MTSTGSSQADWQEEPGSLEEVRLPLEQAARLLAVADGLCAIGQLRTGTRGGQFSIFNFLLRVALDAEYPSPDDRPTHVLLMQAGIIRRHGWYAYFWLPEEGEDGARGKPLRLAAPSPIGKSWHWHDDIGEISRRLEPSEAWRQAVGVSVEERVAQVAAWLETAEVMRTAT